MRKAISIAIIGSLLSAASLADDPIIARVKGERVNLRGRADANGEVVGQATAGQELKVLQPGDLWVAVAPPDGIRCWIHKDFVQEGKVAVKELIVRAGASINYPKIGSLFRGDSVTARETFGDWLCIPPPTNAIVWIHRELIDLPGAAAATTGTPVAVVLPPAPEAAITHAPSPDTPVPKILPTHPEGGFFSRSTPTPPTAHEEVVMPPPVKKPDALAPSAADTNALAGLNLVPLPGQGNVVEHEGFVKSSPYAFAPGRYRLATRKGNQLETICFLRGNSAQLQSLTDQYFLMQGREYWVQGVREPVLIIERIERRPQPEKP